MPFRFWRCIIHYAMKVKNEDGSGIRTQRMLVLQTSVFNHFTTPSNIYWNFHNCFYSFLWIYSFIFFVIFCCTTSTAKSSHKSFIYDMRVIFCSIKKWQALGTLYCNHRFSNRFTYYEIIRIYIYIGDEQIPTPYKGIIITLIMCFISNTDNVKEQKKRAPSFPVGLLRIFTYTKIYSLGTHRYICCEIWM